MIAPLVSDGLQETTVSGANSRHGRRSGLCFCRRRRRHAAAAADAAAAPRERISQAARREARRSARVSPARRGAAPTSANKVCRTCERCGRADDSVERSADDCAMMTWRRWPLVCQLRSVVWRMDACGGPPFFLRPLDPKSSNYRNVTFVKSTKCRCC